MASGPNDLRAGDAGTEVEPKEAIRDDMEQTRAALTEKLESLEHKVMGTVETVQNAVTNTVDTVKEAVSDTVHAVKRAFDLKLQVQKRPWLMVGGSLAAGFTIGRLLGGGLPRRKARRMTTAMSEAAPPAFLPRPPEKPGWFSGLRHQFRDEIATLERAGIGAVMGMVRDLAKRAMPAIAPQLDRAMNSATSKMGGDTIDRPIFQPTDQSPGAAG